MASELYARQRDIEARIREHFRDIHYLKQELREVKASIKEEMDARQRAYDERRKANGRI